MKERGRWRERYERRGRWRERYEGEGKMEGEV